MVPGASSKILSKCFLAVSDTSTKSFSAQSTISRSSSTKWTFSTTRSAPISSSTFWSCFQAKKWPTTKNWTKRWRLSSTFTHLYSPTTRKESTGALSRPSYRSATRRSTKQFFWLSTNLGLISPLKMLTLVTFASKLLRLTKSWSNKSI